MATSTLARPVPGAHSSLPATGSVPQNLLVYWHLYSLDAPTVAMLWTWFIAATCGIHLPLTSIVAMGTAVWILYAADRLLDCSQPRTSPFRHQDMNQGLEARHLFHRHHRQFFQAGIFAAGFALAAMVPRLARPSLLLYSILGGILLLYFSLIHLNVPGASGRRLPKEIAVGVFFSAATFIPTVARNTALRAPLVPAAILFGVTCSLNCLYIYAWEHPVPYPDAHPVTRNALRFLGPLAIVALTGGLCLALNPARCSLSCAVAMSTALLMLLHGHRRHLDPVTLRAAADFCLLTPLLFVGHLLL